MNIEAGVEVMKALEDDPGVRFLLFILKSGGSRAYVVFLMDSWRNSATDCYHRLGQERPVRVHRFVMKMVCHIQETKAKLGKGAMAHLTAEEFKLARIMSLEDFFGVDENVSEEDNDDCECALSGKPG